LDLRLVLGPAFVEEAIDVLLSHESLLGLDGGIEGFAADGFIEFGGAILPKRIGVDGPEDVGDVGSEGGDCSFLVLFTPHLVLFMHLLL
jgi:hypothetical protein